MDARLDEIDKRILYHLTLDARRTSAPDIAEEVHVSAGTIRNRIRQLEERRVIKGYHAHVDYERGEGHLTNLFLCTTAGADRDRLAQQALGIPGVTNVRIVRTGREDLQVKAVGTDTEDLDRIATALIELGVEIEDETLIQREYFQPYQPYGPEDATRAPSMTDFMSLVGDAEVIELTVNASAPITGKTLREANEDGLLDEDTLIVAVERDGEVITPRGQTKIRDGDVVTVFAHDGLASGLEGVFAGEETAAN